MQRLAVAIALALIVLSVTSALGADVAASRPAPSQQVPPDLHDPPVDAPIIDPFRPPAGPYAPGNRGLEYDTTPGQTVRASAAGTVTFSGQVGGHLFVTIRHSPSLRTTVGFVDSVEVSTGERVTKGQRIATAGHTMHFTARRNGTYIDPESLFVHYKVVVRLVATPD